jgi:hypothetical protein
VGLAVGVALGPPTGWLREGLTADGLTPPAEVDPAEGVGVGLGVGPVDVGGVDVGEADVGGVDGALLGGVGPPDGLPVPPPRRVTTAPPGEKVIVLVHGPAGAALVTWAVIATERPAASVPEL